MKLLPLFTQPQVISSQIILKKYTNILRNLFFGVQQKKEIHTGLKRLEGE